ncbi:hypothetical protein pb186bvf_017805 [Paramecium bursaria]
MKQSEKIDRQQTKKSTTIEKSSTTNNQQIQSKLLGANVNEINIEKFRDLKSNNPYQLNGKLTIQNLKVVSNKFSLDSIFVLDLSGQKLTSVDNLSDCYNLVLLNLSNNQISDTSGLRNLMELKFLNLSTNQIAQIDFQRQERLSTLQLQGNYIKSLKAIESLAQLNLQTLYLKSVSGQLKNPLSDLANYRQNIFNLIKSLQRLDGYAKDVQFNDGTDIKQEKQSIKMELQNNQPWYAQKLPKVENAPVAFKEDEDKIANNIKAFRTISQNIEMKLLL